MSGAIFQLDAISEFPLWAQVLIASRIARRGLLAAPSHADAETEAALLAACDAIDRCAAAGEWIKADERTIKAAMELGAAGIAGGAGEAVYYAGDSALAAHSSLDFSAAESACVASAQKAMAAASEAEGLSPLQVRIYLAADLDLMQFACKESSVGRYAGVRPILGRLIPVT